MRGNDDTVARHEPIGTGVVAGAATGPTRTPGLDVGGDPYPEFAPAPPGRLGDVAVLVLAIADHRPSIPIATSANERLLRIGSSACRRLGRRCGQKAVPIAMSAPAREPALRRQVLLQSARPLPQGAQATIGTPAARWPGKKRPVEIGIVEAGFGNCTTRRPQLSSARPAQERSESSTARKTRPPHLALGRSRQPFTYHTNARAEPKT